MTETKTSAIIEEIEETVEAEGAAPGTPQFEKRIRQLKVQKCREFRGMFACSDCMAYDDCELIKQVMRDYRGT